MRIVPWFSSLFLVAVSLPCLAQMQERNLSAMHDIVSLMDFDEIPVAWTMNGESQAFLNEGINSLREGGYLIAIDQLSRALGADGSAMVAFYYRAMAFKQPDAMAGDEYRIGKGMNVERLHRAKADLLLFLTVQPNVYEAKLELGKVLMLLQEVKQAKKQFDKLMDERPKDPRGPYFLGLACLRRGEEAQARKYFDRCTALDPTFTSGLMHLAGIEFFRDKSGRKGLEILDRVLEIDSMQRTARIIRFRMRTDQANPGKDLESSLMDIDFLVRYNPANPRIRMARAEQLIRMEKYDRAFNDIRHVLESNNVDENDFLGQQTDTDKFIDIRNAGYYLLRRIYGMNEEEAADVRKAFCLIMMRKTDEGLKVLNGMERINQNTSALYLRAIAYEHTKSFYQALYDYQKVTRLDPAVFDAQKKCAIILSSEGKWIECLPYFNALEKINPEFLPTYNLRGVAHFNLRDYRNAVADFNEYIQRDTSNTEVYYNRGVCNQELGNLMTAVNDMVRAKDYRALNFLALHQEVDRLLQKGDTASLRSYSGAIMKIPSQSGYGVELELMKVKLMHLERNWTFIGERFRRLLITKSASDNYAYISCTMAAQGSYRVDQGQLTEASGLFDQAIGYDNENAVAYLERGKLMLKLNEHDKAIADFGRAAQLGDERGEKLRSRLAKH